MYDFLTQLLYSQHCDHPVGSITLFGYPDSYHRILGILVQSCSILFAEEPRFWMKHHFPHLNIVETQQLIKWLSDIKGQKWESDYNIGYPLHGSPPYMETPLPTFDQVREEIHRETPEVGQHDLAMYYKDTIIMRVLMRVHELMTPYSPMFITQEKHYVYTPGDGVAFTPLERQWVISRLEQQHPSWTPNEVEEGYERLNTQKMATCPCSEHMKRKSVAVVNIPFIMRKLDLNSDDETNEENEENEVPEDEQVESSDTDSDSGIVPDAPEEGSANKEKCANTEIGEKESEESEKPEGKPCQGCGKVHPALPWLETLVPKPFGLIIRIKPKEKEETQEKEEKKEEEVE